MTILGSERIFSSERVKGLKYLRLTISDTLGFWDNDLEDYVSDPARSQSFTSWYRLPDDWLMNGRLTPNRREALLRYWYGDTWRQGNGDGSQYIVLAIDEQELYADEVARRVWEQTGESCFVIGDDVAISRVEARQL